MGLTGSQKALMYALGGIARGGATRGGYIDGRAYVAIDGDHFGFARDDAPGIIIDSLQITDALDETPNTCDFRVNGTQPPLGAPIRVTLGSKNNGEALFAGVLLSRALRYAAENPRFVQSECRGVDFSWMLSFAKVTKRYLSQNAAAIARDLITTYAAANGFTAKHVAENLPVLDEITFTNEDVGDALTRLARRIGGYWYVDYQKDLHLFFTEPQRNGDPEPLTPAHRSLAHFSAEDDRTQVLTRVYVEGQGARLLSAVAVGDTMLPIDTASGFAVAADVFIKVSPQGSEGGAQHLNFTGIDSGGRGSLVGPGAGPPGAPTLALAVGAGLDAGAYQYAYTFITASGESLPSPIAAIVTGAIIPAPATPPAAFSQAFAGGVTAGPHGWTYTFASAAGETTSAPGGSASTDPFPLSPPGNVTLNVTTNISGGGLPAGRTYNYRVTYTGTAGGETVVSSSAYTFSTPGWAGSQNSIQTSAAGPGVATIRVYRAMGFPSAGPYYLVGTVAPGGALYDGLSDAALVAQPQAPAINTAMQQAGMVTLTGIATGPAGTVARKIYRTRLSDNSIRLVATINDNYSTTYVDTLPDASLGALLPTTNTAGAEYRNVQLSNVANGPASVTTRYIYRTLVNGSQLKRLLGGFPLGSTDYLDNQTDASIAGNLNAPTGDTSGIAQPAGQVAAGASTVPVANVSVFPATGGWAIIGNGDQVIRYTGRTTSALTGLPSVGIGALIATVSYNATITAAPMLTGIPGSGARAIQRTLLKGDELYLVVQVDDAAAQAALAAALGIGTGVREEWIQDRRLSIVEARARGQATLKLRPLTQTGVRYTCRDLRTASGKTISVSLPAPSSVAGTFRIQQVIIGNFRPHPTQYPTFTVDAATSRFSFEDLLRRTRRTV